MGEPALGLINHLAHRFGSTKTDRAIFTNLHSSSCILPRNVALQHCAENSGRFRLAQLYSLRESQFAILVFLLVARLAFRYLGRYQRFIPYPGSLQQ